MAELGKMKRSLAKQDPKAPHETLLVVDATTGSNALAQAREFHQSVGLTGLIVTKLDGSGKGGIVIAIQDELGINTVYRDGENWKTSNSSTVRSSLSRWFRGALFRCHLIAQTTRDPTIVHPPLARRSPAHSSDGLGASYRLCRGGPRLRGSGRQMFVTRSDRRI
jgi:hypothetical protein